MAHGISALHVGKAAKLRVLQQRTMTNQGRMWVNKGSIEQSHWSNIDTQRRHTVLMADTRHEGMIDAHVISNLNAVKSSTRVEFKI